MRLQVLLSTMNQTDHSIIEKTGIQTDAIIINQANEFKKEVLEHKGREIQFLTFDERGVGLSRNNALMRADADVCLIADEDVVYENDYETKVLDAFRENPKADIIIFNVPANDSERPDYTIVNNSRVRRYNCLRYGAVRIAFRLSAQRKSNIYFSLLFGGGAKYSSGEDSLFLYGCIKSGMRVYASPKIIGNTSQQVSTWFNGYTDKYFIDKGVFFGHLSSNLAYLFGLQYVIRKYRSFETEHSFMYVLRKVFMGISEARGRQIN